MCNTYILGKADERHLKQVYIYYRIRQKFNDDYTLTQVLSKLYGIRYVMPGISYLRETMTEQH